MATKSRRDDFSPKVIKQIAQRAAYTCSNPRCRRRTLIPAVADSTTTHHMGVAAHITAASPEGPRFNLSLTTEQRSAIENAIHLCTQCATLIDKNKGIDHPASVLIAWKENHEEWLREQQSNQYVEFITNNRRSVSAYFFPVFDDEVELFAEERSSGYIIFPEDNDKIPSRTIRVVGRIEKKTPRSAYWIAIAPDRSLSLWWPQEKCELMKEDNFFTIKNATLGRELPAGREDIGRLFDIGLYEVTPKAQERFKNASSGGAGIPIPEGAYLLWKTSIMRVS